MSDKMNPGAKEWQPPSWASSTNAPVGVPLKPKEGTLAASQKQGGGKKKGQQIDLGLETKKNVLVGEPPKPKQAPLIGEPPKPAKQMVFGEEATKPAKQVTLGEEPPKPVAKQIVLGEEPAKPVAKQVVLGEEPPKTTVAAKQVVLGAEPTPASPAVSNEQQEEDWEKSEVAKKPVEKKPVVAAAAPPAPVPKKEEKKAAPIVEEEPEDESAVKDEDPREHLNVVNIGHVDAGKSTLCGSILVATGMVDKRTIEKYEKEAKERNRESWYLAYIMDTNEEERQRGKTVEVGTANFATEKKRFTILDAPGHKNYVPAMIAGASHADVGVLVISSRKGEFESGFEKQGQTREHAMLAFTIGIRKLIVAINKLDDPSVAWSKERYDEIQMKLTPYLKNIGYKVKKDVIFMPIAALIGAGVLNRITKEQSEWATEINEGKSLLEILEGLQMEGRDAAAPLRLTVLDSYVDRGVWALGKVESGTLKRNTTVCVSPTATQAKVSSILIDEDSVRSAKPGENVCVKLAGLADESDCRKGYVLTEERIGCKVFTAQIRILELLEHRSIFTAGYTAVLHAHTIISDCTIVKILWKHDPETGKPIKERCTYAKDGDIITIRIEVPQTIAIESFDVRPQLGRITIRDEGKSIAIGKVKKLE